jgi:hypothetical protein
MSKFSKSVRSFIFFLEFLICNTESAACIFR